MSTRTVAGCRWLLSRWEHLARRLEQRLQRGKAIEAVEALVAGQNIAELARHVGAIPRKQHPEILYRRPRAAVVEIDEVRPRVGSGVGPQEVAFVAVTVQTQAVDPAGPFEAAPCLADRIAGDAPVHIGQIRRNPTRVEQVTGGLHAKAFDVQRGPVTIGGANGLNLRIAKQSIGARAATTAEARALGETKGAPLLTMVRSAYDDQGRAVEHGDHIYRASRYSFDLTLTGW